MFKYEIKRKTIDRTVIYNGSIIDLEVHDVELPDGSTSKRELVFHHGAVAVCAITPENEVLLVKQFRKPADQPLLEIPAGKLEKVKIVKKRLLENYKKKQDILLQICNLSLICMGLLDFQVKNFLYTSQTN